MIDAIVPEPAAGAQADYDAAALMLAEAIDSALAELADVPVDELRRARRRRFRAMGVFTEEAALAGAAAAVENPGQNA